MSGPTTGVSRRDALNALALLATGSWAAPALAAPEFPLGKTAVPPEIKAWTDARLQGEIRFRYWGFHAYDAQLWVRPGFDADKPMASPFALSLTYARALENQAISERAIEEIEHQAKPTPEQVKAWMPMLLKAMASVQPGDRLTGVCIAPDRASFYLNGKPTADLNDATLVPLFFGIWLSPQSSQQAMRKALLGLDGKRRTHG